MRPDKTISIRKQFVYNIASRAAQSNSVYVSVLKIPIVHVDNVSKSLRQFFFFARAAIIIFRDNYGQLWTQTRYRDSAHQSQSEDNFPTFSLGLEFLNEAEKQGKRRLGISAVTIHFTARGPWNATNFDRKTRVKPNKWQNWSVSTLKGKLRFFRVKIVYIKLELSTGNLK